MYLQRHVALAVSNEDKMSYVRCSVYKNVICAPYDCTVSNPAEISDMRLSLGLSQKMIFNATFCSNSNVNDLPVVSPECHNGQAYSSSSRITEV